MPADERIFSSCSEQHFHFLWLLWRSCDWPSHFSVMLPDLLASQTRTGQWIMELTLKEGDKWLLVFYHTPAFFLDGGDYSVTCIPFWVCEMGLKEQYRRQGLKVTQKSLLQPSHSILHQHFTKIPWYLWHDRAMNPVVFQRPFRTFSQAR